MRQVRVHNKQRKKKYRYCFCPGFEIARRLGDLARADDPRWLMLLDRVDRQAASEWRACKHPAYRHNIAATVRQKLVPPCSPSARPEPERSAAGSASLRS
jgi:hypothetical protein